MAYYRLFLAHPRILSFGILLTLFSSFGQTFLIAIFVPGMLADFSLNTGQFGALYAAATVASAVSLPFFGRLLDRMELRRYSLLVGAGLMLACFTVALAPNVPMLFLGILGLRLTGQGLLGLTASATMARRFGGSRGKALSISGLGYPLGEGLLPLVMVLLVTGFGLRLSWGLLGIFVGLVLLPLIVSLVKEQGKPGPGDGGAAEAADDGPGVTQGEILRDKRFYQLLPGTLLLPFLLTGLFLYQIPLAESKGWTAALMASAFIGFAAARLICSLAVGPLIDRWGALRIFPYHLIPAGMGVVLLLVWSELWVAYAFLALVGVSQGTAGAITTAMWTEIYGRNSIGSVKGIVSMLGVLGTAASPIIVGAMLQSGITFPTVLAMFIALSVGAVLASFYAQRRIQHFLLGKGRPAAYQSSAL